MIRYRFCRIRRCFPRSCASLSTLQWQLKRPELGPARSNLPPALPLSTRDRGCKFEVSVVLTDVFRTRLLLLADIFHATQSKYTGHQLLLYLRNLVLAQGVGDTSE